MTTRSILVKACLNGSRTRDEHPQVASTPEELAADAGRAVAAGAGALHIHPRGADGAESVAGPVTDATVRAIRAACPGTPVGVTTGAWIEPDLEARLAKIGRWTERPDFASVNVYEAGAPEVAH